MPFVGTSCAAEQVEQVAVSQCDYAYSLVFTAYLSNTVISGKSPFYSCSSEACSARISVDTQTETDKPSTVTLAAHARRGLTTVHKPPKMQSLTSISHT